MNFTKGIYKCASLIVLLLCCMTINGQGKIKDFKWKKAQKSPSIPAKWQNEDAVCVKMKRSYFFEIIDLRTWRTKTVFTVIQRVKIQTEQGVKKFSVFSLSKADNDQVMIIDARVIKPNGKVVDVNTADIKQQEFSSLKNQYAFDVLKFAVPGVEVGDEIEFIYKLKKESLKFGGEEYLHTSLPTMKSEIKFRFPRVLEFEIINYNGMPEFSNQESLGDFVLKWNAQDLESMGNDYNSMKWSELPYFSYVIRNLYSGSGGEVKKHSLVPGQWDDIYKRYDEVYHDGRLGMRSGAGYYDEYMTAKKREFDGNKYALVEKLINDFNRELKFRKLSDEETNNPVGFFLKEGFIDHRNYHTLVRRTLKELDVEYNVCFGRNKYQGVISSKNMAGIFISDVFFSYKTGDGKTHFIFPGDEKVQYYLDELPHHLLGTEVYMINGKSFNARNVNVQKIVLDNKGKAEYKRNITYHAKESASGIELTKISEESLGLAAIKRRSYFQKRMEDPELQAEEHLKNIKEVENIQNKCEYTYENQTVINVNSVSANLNSIELVDICPVEFIHEYDDSPRVLDYHPQHYTTERMRFTIDFDSPISLVNQEAVNYDFSNQAGMFQVRVSLSGDNLKLNIDTTIHFSGETLQAESYQDIIDLSKSISGYLEGDLVYKSVAK